MTMWSPLKLKADEAVFFLEQLRAHTRYPRLFLYYLSAFLTSARSVTFHLQKQFVAGEPEKLYEPLRAEMLSDAVCSFFVKLRNEVEKEGYPTLRVEQLAERKSKDASTSVWYLLSGCTLSNDQSDSGLDFLEKLIRTEWELTSMRGPPAHISYRWSFPDYPGGSTEVSVACEDFIRRLWQFIFEFRNRWEAINDPDAWEKKFGTFLGLGSK